MKKNLPERPKSQGDVGFEFLHRLELGVGVLFPRPLGVDHRQGIVRGRQVRHPIGEHLHVTGDMVLQSVGERLEACLEDGDTVAHLSGDEFPIILTGIKNRAEAESKAKEILQRLAEPFTIEGKEIYTTGSIGVVLYPDSATTIGDLMRTVDTAAYYAKEQGPQYLPVLFGTPQRRCSTAPGNRNRVETGD